MPNRDRHSPHAGVKPGPFWSRFSFKIGVGLFVFLMLVLVANYYVAETRGREAIAEQTQKLNYEIGQSILLKLRERLASAESLTTSMANLATMLPKDEGVFRRIFPHLMAEAGMEGLIAGGGIWPEPGAFTPGVARRSFFWGRDAQGSLDYYDDYNDPDGRGYHHEEWYVPARYLKPGEVYWSKSYMDPYSKEPMVTCTVPMWQDGMFAGVATIDLKLQGLSDFMREQAQVIGGYAFALDRNQRLLALPSTGTGDETFRALIKHDRIEFPTMDELARYYDGFQALSGLIQGMNARILEGVRESGSQKMTELASAIARGSDQIELDEAKTIAANLLGRSQIQSPTAQSSLTDDPILSEAVVADVFAMTDTGWRIVVVMPARYAQSVLSDMTDRMLGLLLVLVIIASILFALFFNTAFLMPISRLTSQVRRLVSRQDYQTKLDTAYSDELAQLAAWFNIRSAQLAEALDALQSRNSELDDARKEAEQANLSKNIFLASMSHEIRTPMNAVIGMAEVLERSGLKAEQSAYLHTISSSAQALLTLINDIMDFSKIEANQLDLEYIPFNLRTTLDDCAELIAFQASEKGLDFVYFLSPDLCDGLMGDAGRLRQVVLNLASNAVKFTASGHVKLWIESTSRDDAHVGLTLQVSDTGMGISETSRAQIFSPFIQGDSSTTRKFGGTGLGLAITRHLVELMGGSIEFESGEGLGTVFTIALQFPFVPTLDAITPTQRRDTGISRSLEGMPLMVLAHRRMQAEVIERYGQALGCQCQPYTDVRKWVQALYDCHEKGLRVATVCSDPELLDDARALLSNTDDFPCGHRLIVLENRLSAWSRDAVTYWSQQVCLNVLVEPLKYDEFRRSLCDPDSKSTEIDVLARSDNKTAQDDLSDLASCKILVAEDNKINQQVILLLLKNLGLEADLANDGREAVEAAEKQHYDLILMDWQMPRLDGLEATRAIRGNRPGSKPVIIAVTANAMTGDLDRCLQAGMDDYISKPVRREQLKRILRHWLAT